jgi:L-alanine-DL-glutamate epimerase-like enolase superfamily enzyme
VKVSKVTPVELEIPYKSPIPTSDGTVTHARSLLTMVETSDGLVGFGEAPSEVTFSEESLEDMALTLDRYLTPAVMDQDPFDIELIHRRMDRAIPRHYLAKSTIDIALYDVMGKALNVPVHRLLGGMYNQKVRVVEGVIGAVSEERARSMAEGFHKNGCSSYKVKIGTDPKDDVKRVAAIRGAAGPDAWIGVDANEAYRPDVAVRVARELEAQGVAFIEQPVPAWDHRGMASVASALQMPVVADESVFSIHDAHNVIAEHEADGINLKIHKPGGLLNAKKIASMIEAAGISCLIGWGTTGVTAAAALQLAATMPCLDLPCEFNVGQIAVEGDITKEVLRIEDGWMRVPEGPGLGVGLDDAKLERYRTARR